MKRASIHSFYEKGEKVLSFEFFPPKREDLLPKTEGLIQELSKLHPHFMTVTYGAGGGTRIFTRRLVRYISKTLGQTAAAHLTCVGHSKHEIDAILDDLKSEGISNIVSLRGDAPKDSAFESHPEGFSCARDLTAHIMKRGDFSVAVAGYPETHRDAQSPQSDIAYLKEKMDAGAGVILTQLFFDPAVYFDFVKRARAAGITVPIVPGIMPINDSKQIERFTTMCGASIPKKIRDDLARIGENQEKVMEYGTRYAIDQCRELLKGGAPGIHLYTLNKSPQVISIVEELGLGRSLSSVPS